MTTLAAHSSPDLAGSNNATWLRIVALYGVGPLLAVFLTVWLTRTVSAKQDAQLSVAQATKTMVEQHGQASHEQLDRIARQLEVNCRVAALLARNKAAEATCEVGR